VLQLAATVDVEVLLTLNDTATPGEILLQGKVGTLSLKLKVVSSTIGNVNTVIINTALTTLLNTIVKPAVNKALSSGIPLPIPAGQGHITSVDVLYFDGYQAITANIGAA